MRKHKHLGVVQDVVQGLDVLLGKFQSEGILATLATGFQGRRNSVEGLADTAGLLVNPRGLSLALKDSCLLDTLGNVNLRFTLTLRVQNF